MRPPSRRRRAASRKPLKHPLEVDGDDLVERRVIGLGEAGQLHDAGVVHQHIDAAVGALRRIEQPLHCLWVADIGLHGDRLAVAGLDFLHQRRCRRRIAGVVDDDGKDVVRQTPGDSGADAPGRACDDGDLLRRVGHRELLSPLGGVAD